MGHLSSVSLKPSEAEAIQNFQDASSGQQNEQNQSKPRLRRMDRDRSRGRLSIIACNSGEGFAERMSQHLNELIGEHTATCHRTSKEVFFSNKEVKTVIEDNIRGDDVYVVQCMDDPLSRHERSTNDNLMALCTALDAAYNSDADRITAVIPQYPYSRQERKKGRESITARQIATFLEASGADRVITLDIHAEPIEGFFRQAHFENVHASHTIIEYIRHHLAPIPDLTVVAPDVGSVERARYYSRELKADLAVVDKVRDYSRPSSIESVRLIGNVEGRNIIIADDMIATGGTIVNAARLLRSKGAKKIYLACSLPYFNGSAVEKLDQAYQDGIIEKVIGTDAVYHGPEFMAKHEWYAEVSIAELFARVIYNINNRLSVSELLK